MVDDITDPVAAAAIEERQELFRIAAQRVVDAHAAGRKTDPEALKWARGIVKRIKPLGRPLSTGEHRE
jgi:hypothetical protein